MTQDRQADPGPKTFYSKRNRVWRTRLVWNGQEIDAVAKKYLEPSGTRREYEILQSLTDLGVAVPLPLCVQQDTLYMEYLPGIILTDLLDRGGVTGQEWIRELARWFYVLHDSTRQGNGVVMLKDDNNPRNFILYRGVFYGLDFEIERYGQAEQDIGSCSAFMLSNSPAFSEEKVCIVKQFIQCYMQYNQTISNISIEKEIQNALYELAKRRPNQKEEILLNMDSIKWITRGES